MKSAGKARNNGLYRHIRTSKEIIRNLLNDCVKNNKDISYGYKFVDGNIGVSEEGIVTLPLYMIAFI